MRRGPKPAKAKAGARHPARPSRPSEAPRVRDFEKRLAEALDQQTATSEILRVIASSPNDLGPVAGAVSVADARLGGDRQRVGEANRMQAGLPRFDTTRRDEPRRERSA